jgi:hypothetical protein
VPCLVRHRLTLRANTSDEGFGVAFAYRRGPPVSHLHCQVQVTGRNGKAGRHAGVLVSRRRRLGLVAALAATSALLVAGCGGGGGDSADALPAATAPAGDSADALPAATAPAGAAAPVAVAPVAPGGQVRAGADTPKAVAKALAGSDVVVVAFLVKGMADDESVAEAVEEARTGAASDTGVEWFVYNVGNDRFGDLADLLGVTGTPSVAVIGRDRILANLWTGLVDAEILSQSVSDAKDTAAENLADAAKKGR